MNLTFLLGDVSRAPHLNVRPPPPQKKTEVLEPPLQLIT